MFSNIPLVDIHCHLLPEIDDGARDWPESLAMAEIAVSEGFQQVIATPHQLGNYPQNHGNTIRKRANQLQQHLDLRKIELEILPGADVRMEPDLIARVRRGDVLTLADRGRHVLLELPHEVFLPMDRLLESMNRAGLVGILSHPERNLGILARPNVVDPLVDNGCLLQVTAGSITGTFGPDCRKLAERLVEDGMVHFLATDAHHATGRRPLMQKAFARVAELTDYDTAVRLCCHNPAKVAAGQDVHAGRFARRRSVFGRLLSWRKAS